MMEDLLGPPAPAADDDFQITATTARSGDVTIRLTTRDPAVRTVTLRTENLSDVWLWDCLGAANQQWQAGGTSTPPAPALLADRNAGRCLDVLGAGREAGTPLVLYDCYGGENQRFTSPAAGQTGELRVYGDWCVQPAAGGTGDGPRLVIAPCAGGAAQRWARTAAGEFRGEASGKCVDVLGGRTENLTDVWLWTCLGAPNQQWDPRAPSQTVASAAR
jgi:hypothetical protein